MNKEKKKLCRYVQYYNGCTSVRVNGAKPPQSFLENDIEHK